MSEPIVSGLDGVIASGNTPLWIIPSANVTPGLSEKSADFSIAHLTSAGAVKADCYMNMDGFDVTREATTRERKRMCEKVTKTVKTGETINGSITAIFDQQAQDAAQINAVYDVLAEGETVYIVRAYGLDSQTTPTASNKADVWRVTVNQRNKNQPVDGEDLMFTADLSGDLYLQDVPFAA